MERLRQALLGAAGGQPRRVGVCGMGGSGKSVLAAAASREREVRRRFPDVAWVRLDPPTNDTAVRTSALIQKQRELLTKLGEDSGTGEIADVDQGRNRLAEVLRERPCLLVVDNVWTPQDVYAFNVPGRRGALVWTTRDVGLVRVAGAVEVEVAELTDEQARSVAAGWAGVDADALPAAALQTLRLVGNLALGVATVAARARGDVRRWADVADRLRAADLAALRLQFPDYHEYPSLLAALQIGLDFLSASERSRYRELVVFAGRGPVPRSAVEALWSPCALSAAEVGDLLAMFEERALLFRDSVTGRLDLHDLQFDVARVDLERTLPNGLQAAHRQLLAGYAARCPAGWPSGPPDDYLFPHLAEHLVAAGRHEELAELLSDIEWMRARLTANDVTGLLADYTFLPNDPDLALVQGTIRLSTHTLAADPDQLPAQLAGRTLGRQEPVLARLHAAAQLWSQTGWLEPLWPTLAQTGEGLRQTLPGHPGGGAAVAISADGATAVSGGGDGVVRVWDLTGAAAPRELPGHRRGLLAVAISADGATAVGGGDDGVVKVWDLTVVEDWGDWIRSAAPRELPGHPGAVAAVAISADGATAVSGGGYDGALRVWDLTGHQQPVRWIADHAVRAVALGSATVLAGDVTGRVHALRVHPPAAVLR